MKNSVSDPDLDRGISVIAVGNPGVGKSLFLNILIGDHVFKSGITIGKGRFILSISGKFLWIRHIVIKTCLHCDLEMDPSDQC